MASINFHVAIEAATDTIFWMLLSNQELVLSS